ncbi:TlpA disulfide reductase family protein [Undibacterium sp. Ren11W]|uniref:TlpA disulfide reductase family protein n=1 Tax=Undibacterium sp. Ren11W TaxID=3413045 RepID=UPI003BF35240
MNKRFLPIAVICALVFALIGAYAGMQHTEVKPAQNGAVQKLMSLTLPDSQGRAQKLSQWQGKILLVNFWATWCAPCVQEMPELSALQKDLSKNNVQLLGMGIDSPSNIKDFANKYHIDYPLFSAGMEGTELSRLLGNQNGGLPFTLLIAADGSIIKTYLGRLKMDVLRADISKITGSH